MIMTTDQQGEMAAITVLPRKAHTGVNVLEIRAGGKILTVCLPSDVTRQLINDLVAAL